MYILFESVSRKSYDDSTFLIVIVQRNFSIIDQELHYDLLDGKLLYLCSSGSYKKSLDRKYLFK